MKTIKKNDKVRSPHAGRARTDGTSVPEFGTVKSVSRGYAYVDFGGGGFEPIPVSSLIRDGQNWKES